MFFLRGHINFFPRRLYLRLFYRLFICLKESEKHASRVAQGGPWGAPWPPTFWSPPPVQTILDLWCLPLNTGIFSVAVFRVGAEIFGEHTSMSSTTHTHTHTHTQTLTLKHSHTLTHTHTQTHTYTHIHTHTHTLTEEHSLSINCRRYYVQGIDTDLRLHSVSMSQ